MSFARKETKKLFYQIGEVASELNVNVSLIRFWEKEFDIIKPKKNKKGNRQFSQKDFDNLKIIHFLVKEKGYTLEGAKKKIKENKEDKIDNLNIVRHLKEIRKFLVDLKEQL
jgi:DNA-binding transcriptional MerR regulator|tara:strand:+ start:53 stop:388 length:336 start_codon:yes stop_codon:yes gene_type:complete